MKYNKILFLFFICTMIPCIAQKFETVAMLYSQKEYDRALDILNTMNPKNATIWYNMGNCAYKKQDFYHAWAYWSCAHAIAPNSIKNTIQYNIDVVEHKLQHPVQEGFFKKISVLYRSIALVIFQLFFLISWFALLFFIKKYKHGTKYRSVFFILLLCITTVSGIALGFKYRTINQRRGIVMKHDVSLFAGPDDQYHVLGSLEGVSEVVVHESRASWYKVSTKNNAGWVMQDSIVVV